MTTLARNLTWADDCQTALSVHICPFSLDVILLQNHNITEWQSGQNSRTVTERVLVKQLQFEIEKKTEKAM